jgi:hypothetical protein
VVPLPPPPSLAERNAQKKDEGPPKTSTGPARTFAISCFVFVVLFLRAPRQLHAIPDTQIPTAGLYICYLYLHLYLHPHTHIGH